MNCKRVLLYLAPYSLLLTAVAGCAQPAAESASMPAEQPAVVIAPQSLPTTGTNPQPQPEPPKPEPPPPTFAFTPDLTGKSLPRVVAPDVSRPLPGDRFGVAATPRTVPAQVLDPDAFTRARFLPPAVLPPNPPALKPTPPPEKLPLTLGAGADDVPAKPVLPVAAIVTPRARDVNLPPPPPVLGRPLADRVSLDDPTGELGNAVVVAGRVKTTLPPSGFLKVGVPDPFELAEQVKPKVPTATEPVVTPVVVNPQRVK